MSDLTIAVAGGHTNTRVALFDGQAIHAASIPSGWNYYTQSDDKFFEHFFEALKTLDFPPDELETADLRLILPGSNETVMRRKFRERGVSFASLRVIDDTIGVLLANLGGLEGICAFAGSGAAVLSGVEIAASECIPSMLGTLDGKLDGFGPLVGDFGSGFRFASEVLSTAVRLAERVSVKSAGASTEGAELLEWLCEYDPELLNIHDWIRSFQQSIAESWTSRVSKLAVPIVRKVEMAKANGEMQAEIEQKPTGALAYAVDALERSAIQMANTVKISLMRQPDELNVPIVCHGGMFSNSDHYFDTFKEELRSYPGEILRADYHYVIGGFLVGEGINQPRKSQFDLIIRSIEELDSDSATKRLLKLNE